MTPDNINHSEAALEPQKPEFRIVAIGAAAGGVAAMTELLQHLPQINNSAIIYLQYPDTYLDGSLEAALAKATTLDILVAEPGIKLEPGRLYILAPEKGLLVQEGVFQKETPAANAADSAVTINKLFTSLAEAFEEKAAGILLSGSISDGALGMKAIKLAGGITFAQNESARFGTLPKSAIAEGAVDMVLPVHRIAEELERLSEQDQLFQSAMPELNEELLHDKDANLQGILYLLLRATGVDFRLYKLKTIKRRILRRMMLYKIKSPQEYLGYLRQNPNEVDYLYQDLLINVTSFFRDEETTTYIQEHLLPKIIQTKASTEPIRAWVPACSTGQEAYSLAMMVLEALGRDKINVPIQIFATDLSETAIAKARMGMYSREEVATVPAKLLNRYFTKIDGHYRVAKRVRDVCIFAIQNVVKDPPFSRLDLISCCNLMIYLDNPLQRKLMSIFHYSLNKNGYLILGKSETVGALTNLFTAQDKKIKVYTKRKDASTKSMFDMPSRYSALDGPLLLDKRTGGKKTQNNEADLEEAMNQMLLKKFTPASVVVNIDLDILHFRGATGLYLEPAPGKASLNLMKIAKTGLGFELRNIVYKAQKSHVAVKKEGLEIKIGDKMQRITIEAMPLNLHTEEEYFVVVFEQVNTPSPEPDAVSSDRRVVQLENELTALREDMRSIIEMHEAANEELQSANEEIVSSNEELQSMNEELETSKEEIESSNEELITINQELQMRNEQLAEAQEYSEELFATIRESVLILDREMRVRMANKTFYKTFRVREEETEGRLIYDLGNRQWNIPKLRELLEQVIPENTAFEGFEVSHTFLDIGEKTMLLNARKVIQRVNGQEVLLLAIEDITEHRQAQKIIAEREAWFHNMADNAPVMIWVTGLDQLCNFANKHFLEFRGITTEEAIGKSWILGAHPDDEKRCQQTYNVAFYERNPFAIEYRLQHVDGTYMHVLTRAKPNFTTEGSFTGFIGTCVEWKPA